MPSELTLKEKRFISKLSEGKTQHEAGILAGYSPHTVDQQASRLMRKDRIIKALDRIGLTEASLARELKYHVEAGKGIKETADTSLKALGMVMEAKSLLDSNNNTNNSNTNNINVYIQELKQMNNIDLVNKLDSITKDIEELRTKL